MLDSFSKTSPLTLGTDIMPAYIFTAVEIFETLPDLKCALRTEVKKLGQGKGCSRSRESTPAEKRKARNSNVGTQSLSFERLVWMRSVRCVQSVSIVFESDDSVYVINAARDAPKSDSEPAPPDVT